MSKDKQQPLKETLNLPKTDFPIRAGLSNKEPEILGIWDQDKLDNSIADQKNLGTYHLHDGPPYPNGNIHMGHALNKILKDIIVRSKQMIGLKSTYIPGWDCHGLPIETQVLKQLKKEKNEDLKHDIPAFRRQCERFATTYVDNQKEEFKRLGIRGRWNDPYLTLNKSYEAQVIALFGTMAENGLIYRGRKPIHWCTHCETALAEAEIEYAEHKSPSIFSLFKLLKASKKLGNIDLPENTSILVWTTTPWTLPANVAIAAHPRFTYVVVKHEDRAVLIVKEQLAAIQAALEWDTVTILGELSGTELKDTVTQHPFIDRSASIVLADYVTNEDGTGFVHIAPGHGQEDYQVGLNYNLPTLMPVDEKGCFFGGTSWDGVPVFEANKSITQLMAEKGTLAKLSFIKHQYPHCWRCKNPVIFRATAQWFVAMDKPFKNGDTLRNRALAAIKETGWYPAWGEKRITSMIENRPDWCISRQRSWGIPLPVFICKSCDHAEMTGAFNTSVKNAVSDGGSIVWFEKPVTELLPEKATCSKCGKSDFEKEDDILDVWFESGASFSGVLETEKDLSVPADLYLEGSDQHRGWFQSSLLISIATREKAPFRHVLTHGFIVDEKGRKMSKSVGNVISPQKVIKQHGADILRWWVASTDFKNDISISDNILNQAKDAYTKVRNTLRFCLSNLYDFDPKTDVLPTPELNEIDQWILHEFYQLNETINKGYNNFEFHLISHSIHDFCATTLSAIYLDITKDRLYCGRKKGQARRSTQTALFLITQALLTQLAPILAFTADDAYTFFDEPGKQTHIHLKRRPQSNDIITWKNTDLAKRFQTRLDVRNQVYQQLEALRSQKIINSNLEASVVLTLPKSLHFDDWASFLIVSKVDIVNGQDIAASCGKSPHDKCERCWKRLPLTETLCQRCNSVVHQHEEVNA